MHVEQPVEGQFPRATACTPVPPAATAKSPGSAEPPERSRAGGSTSTINTRWVMAQAALVLGGKAAAPDSSPAVLTEGARVNQLHALANVLERDPVAGAASPPPAAVCRQADDVAVQGSAGVDAPVGRGSIP